MISKKISLAFNLIQKWKPKHEKKATGTRIVSLKITFWNGKVFTQATMIVFNGKLHRIPVLIQRK
jgi:hypothetical protein